MRNYKEMAQTVLDAKHSLAGDPPTSEMLRDNLLELAGVLQELVYAVKEADEVARQALSMARNVAAGMIPDE